MQLHSISIRLIEHRLPHRLLDPPDRVLLGLLHHTPEQDRRLSVPP